MHALLAPAAIPLSEAHVRVRAWVRVRYPAWRAARLALSREREAALATALAWNGLSRDLLTPGTDSRLLGRAREELVATVQSAVAGRGESAMGTALAWLVARFELPDLLLRSRIVALERDAHLFVFASRKELRTHVARTVHPEARLYLRALGLSAPARHGEREEQLALALANGIERAVTVPRARALLAATGRLAFTTEDLVAHGVRIGELTAEPGKPATSAGVRALVAAAVRDARAELAKGWPLCHDLGPLQGRALAALLRWHAASLSALEARGFALPPAAPPAGTLRLAACTATAGITRTLPRW